MAGDEVKHEYHLVNPSAWPLFGSGAAAVMMIGAVAWMEGDAGLFGIKGPWMFGLGFSLILVTMLGWWRDVIKESLTGESTSTVIRLGLRYGMILFIASEVMFFAAWFWAFFGAALFPGGMELINLPSGPLLNEEGLPAFLGNDGRAIATGSMWPPQGVTPLNPWHLPLINTLILLLSGTTVTWAHHAVVHKDKRGLLNGLLVTIALGSVFTFFQYLEYSEALGDGLFKFSGGGIYGASFFMATGFHGLHVLIGTLFLLVCYFRARKDHFTPDRHFGFEAAAWYWHFVDVVWLFLFACIYILGNQGFLS